MIALSISQLIQITGGKLLCGTVAGEITHVTSDSRAVQNGSLFVALRGEKVDGHDYVQQAFEQGAVCALVEKECDAEDTHTVVLVADAIKAMGALAQAVLKQLSVPVVAITGSVGKTTTRDMTHAVLSQKFETLKNKKNFNNELGVPLTIFEADNNTEAAVIEMGMDHFGEIDRLAAIAQPDVALVTNIGMSHIEQLGSQENIYKAKSELFAHTKADGVIILNGDDKILMAHRSELTQHVITVGVSNTHADLVAKDICPEVDSVSFQVCGMGHEFSVTLPVPGVHNVTNALLACAVGICYHIPCRKIKDALAHFTMTDMRMDIFRCGTITVINDCYNAAPASVAAALSVLSGRPGRSVAILGDIAALGAYSYDAHVGLGAEVVKNKIDLLITVGEQAKYIAQGAFENGMDSADLLSVDTVEELYSRLSSYIKENDTVLVKASRVMGLERVVDFLKKNF